MLIALSGASGHAETYSLEALLTRLQEQGYPVLYSTDIVAPDLQVELDTVSLQSFRRWLWERSLTLEAVGDHWVIAPLPEPVHSALEIESQNGSELVDLTVHWRGRALAPQRESDGTFRVPVPPGSRVEIAAAGHLPQQFLLHAGINQVVLSPSNPVENIIVTGTRHRLDGTSVTGSVTSFSADELTSVPSLAGDAMRATARLPGMASMGVSAKPYVRGGLQDELLVRLDGVELLDAYHLADFQNIFSVIDDRSVEAVDVYTGGFPARYGNRMSGVMEVTSSRPDDPARTELGLSLFSLQANTQGTLRDGDVDYLLSARRGNLDEVLERADPGVGRPRYHDALVTLGYRPGEHSRLSVSGFLTRDDVTLTEDETRAESNIDSRYLWSRLELGGEDLKSAHTLAYTGSERRKRQFDLDDDSGIGGFLDYRQDLWKVRAASDWRLRRDGWLMEFGGHVEYASADYDSAALVDRGLLGELLSGSALDGHDIHVDPDGWSGGVYWAAEIPLTGRLTLQPGLRWDDQDFSPSDDGEHLSPRIGLRYDPHPGLSIHLDAGRFRQPEEIQELKAADGLSSYAGPQNADHYILGVEWRPAPGWEAEVEIWDKRYRDTRTRFENLYNPFVLVPEIEPDRVRLDPDRARAAGADLRVRRQFSERASLTLHYSYLDAEDRIDGEWVPRRWSQRHTATALAQWLGARFTASVALTWHSGWRGADVPATLPEGATLNLTDVLSGTELRDYLSLDVSIRRTWELQRLSITAFAGATNLTDRDNVAGVEYDPEEEDGVIVFEEESEFLLPLVPTLGVLVAF